MATFKDNAGKPDYHHSGFYYSKVDGGGSNNWSYKTCKAPIKSSPPTNQHLIPDATQKHLLNLIVNK